MNLIKKAAGTILLCGAVLLGFASPLLAQSGKKLTIATTFVNFDNEFWAALTKGGELFAKTKLAPGSYELALLPNDGDEVKQLNGVKALIASKGKGNIIFYIEPANAANLIPLADILEAAQCYWSATWHCPPEFNPTKYKYFVSFASVDGVPQGYQIAVEMFKRFKTPNKGRILALQGVLGQDSANERDRGLDKALKEFPGVQLLDRQVADWSGPKALEITETWLAKYGEVDGIWAANDTMALAAIQALKAKGLNGKVKVCGVDGGSLPYKAIQDGDLTASAFMNGVKMASYTIAYAYAAYSGQLKPDKIPLEQRYWNMSSEVLTKDNLATYPNTTFGYGGGLPNYDFKDLTAASSGPFMRLVNQHKKFAGMK
jgi:ABC-type sugar transport system substrate-binding protein